MKITLQEILNGQIFTRERIKRQYKWLACASILLIIYIYAGFYAQVQYSKMTTVRKQLKEAEFELQTLQGELTDRTKQSALANELNNRNSNVKENIRPPKRIK